MPANGNIQEEIRPICSSTLKGIRVAIKLSSLHSAHNLSASGSVLAGITDCTFCSGCSRHNESCWLGKLLK
jgi:hypothetical protein